MFEPLFKVDNKKYIIYTDGGARGNPGPKFACANFLTPCGFSISTTGKLPFSRPLSQSQNSPFYYYV